MDSRCYYCVYRDKSWDLAENGYGCEAAELGLCGRPDMKQRKYRMMENKCVLCSYRNVPANAGQPYGCEAGSLGMCSTELFEELYPEDTVVLFTASYGEVKKGIICGVEDMETDPKYVIDVDGEKWYVIADTADMKRCNL